MFIMLDVLLVGIKGNKMKEKKVISTNGYLRRDGDRWIVEAPPEPGKNLKIYVVVGEVTKPLAWNGRKVSFLPYGLHYLIQAHTLKIGWNAYIYK